MSTPLPPANPGTLAVCGLSQARRHHRKFGAVITCEDPGTRDRLRVRGIPQLVLAFEDCDDLSLGYQVATTGDMERALEFERTYRDGSILVHCQHGVGRSAAIALMALADRLGEGREPDAIAALLLQNPRATPNLVAIQLADDLLRRRGALLAALQQSEACDPAKMEARRNRHEYARRHPGEFRKIA